MLAKTLCYKEGIHMAQSFLKRNRIILIVFGMLGQIAWAVENMYFNLFLFDTVSHSLEAVTLMVQLSGITATVVTMIAGTLSDKLGNRRTFISVGYLIWGITVISFSFISVKNTEILFGLQAQSAVTFTLGVIVVMDCVMTLFGSTANDACFNAWVTDNTESSYRGKIESILSVFPLISMLIVAGGFGMLVEAVGYPVLFGVLGAIITLSGIFGIFYIKDSPTLTKNPQSSFKDIFYGFKSSVVKNNAKLYLTLLVIGIYGIACQIFMPYLIIYMKTYLGFSVMEYSIVFGIAIIAGAIVALLLGKFLDKWNKINSLFVFILVFSLGLIFMYLCKGMDKTSTLLLFGISGAVMIIGYILTAAVSGALVRDYMPRQNVGKLQGIRMIFSVLLPMFFGPMIGNAINARVSIPLPDSSSADVMTTAYIPAPEIFFAASLVALLSLIFIFLLFKQNKTEDSENV